MPKKIILFTALIVSLIDCKNKTQQIGEIISEYQLPEDAVPMSYIGHIYVHGELDGIEGNFLFDTGSPIFCLDSTYYASHNFLHGKLAVGFLQGAGVKPQKVGITRDTLDFRLGINYYQTVIIPIMQLKPILGDFADGVADIKNFYQNVVEINYSHEYMKFYSSIDSIDVSDYQSIKLRKQNDKFFIPLSVQINDKLTISGDFLLDSGSGASISFTSSTAEKYDLGNLINEKVRYYTKYGGVGGESSRFEFKAKSVSIKNHVLDDVVVGFSNDKSGALSSNQYLGLLGNDILEKFDVVIDFINNYIYLKPSELYNNAFRFSRLSFRYANRSQTLGAWIVSGLYENGEAESLGLQIDDRIIAVNGIDVRTISFRDSKNYFDSLDSVKLTVERDNETKIINLELKSVL